MEEHLHNFYLDKSEPSKSCLLALRSIILRRDTHMVETTKYGMPCFCYKNKACCYLWVDKKNAEPYILFVEGNLLAHPELEVGDRSRMKILRIDPTQDIAIDTVTEILDDALELYRNGTIKTKG